MHYCISTQLFSKGPVLDLSSSQYFQLAAGLYYVVSMQIWIVFGSFK